MNRFRIGPLLVASLILVTSLSGCSTVRKIFGADGVSDSGLTEEDLALQRQKRFGSGNIPTAEGEGLFRDVHFGFDSTELGDDAQQNIDYNIQIMERNPSLDVQLEGHCDERGTAEYNLSLGSRRGEAVRDVLVAAGVNPSRLRVISYGEEVPINPGHTEEAWARNRRVHFSAFPRE